MLILHRLVRKWAGDTAAHLAALAFALDAGRGPDVPLQQPRRAADLPVPRRRAGRCGRPSRPAKTRWLVLSAALVGLAFETKMLQAFLVLPAFILVYLVAGKPKLGKRLLQLTAALGALIVSAGWWIAIVALWPASARPYIGSTTDNSILSLLFGYNGLSRIFGGSGPSGGGGGAPGGAGRERVRRLGRTAAHVQRRQRRADLVAAADRGLRARRGPVADASRPPHRPGPGRLAALGRLDRRHAARVQPVDRDLPPVLRRAARAGHRRARRRGSVGALEARPPPAWLRWALPDRGRRHRGLGRRAPRPHARLPGVAAPDDRRGCRRRRGRAVPRSAPAQPAHRARRRGRRGRAHCSPDPPRTR